MPLQVIIAVSMVSAIGGLVFNTMPLLVQSLGAALSLSEARLGELSFAAGVGYLLGTMSGPFWIDRFNWRLSAVTVSSIAALSFITSAHSAGSGLYASWVAFGFFCAMMHALTMRILADAPDPELAYGTRLSVELISISVLLFFLPIYFISQYGYQGAAYGLAGSVVLLGLGVALMPSASSKPAEDVVNNYPSFGEARTAYTALAVFLAYLMANVGLWIFLAVIGGKFSPTGEQFGLMFSVLKILGGVAGIAGAAIGARLGLRPPHILCFALVTLGVIGLWTADNFTMFMVSAWVWEFGFTLGCLYQTAAIARTDPSGKLVVLVTTAFGVSILAGGWVAGQMLEQVGDGLLYVSVVVAAALPLAFFLISEEAMQGANQAAE